FACRYPFPDASRYFFMFRASATITGLFIQVYDENCTKYDLGEMVFLKHDPDQNERMITSIEVTPQGIIYYLSCGVSETKHYEMELTLDKDIVKSTSN